MPITTFVLLTLVAAREPLPIPGWNPRAAPVAARSEPVAEAPTLPLAEATESPPGVAEAPNPGAASEGPPVRNVALTFGLGALVMAPSVELEVAPWRHVSLYAGAEASALQLGGGGQAGVRLRPLEWLQGPFLDVHVRFSRYAGLLGPSVEETANPGVMAGFSWVSEGGFVITGGLGLNCFTKTTTTEVHTSLASSTYFPVPKFDVTHSTRIGPSLETRLALGWAF